MASDYLSSQPSQKLHFLDLPREIRDIIYSFVVAPEHRYVDEYRPLKPKYSLECMRVSKQIRDEATKVFRKENLFFVQDTPWQDAEAHINIRGQVPLVAIVTLSGQETLYPFHDFVLQVNISGPPLRMDQKKQRLVMRVEDLDKYTKMWWLSQLTIPELNSNFDLVLKLGYPSHYGYEDKPLSRQLQARLLSPFGIVRHLRSFVIEGKYDPALENSVKADMQKPEETPENILERSTALHADAESLIKEQNYAAARTAVYQAFEVMYIMCSGRIRFDWGESQFGRKLYHGRYRGQDARIVRILLRIQLVATMVSAYLLDKNYDEACFWGNRTINTYRTHIGENPDADEHFPISGFRDIEALGRIFERTGQAERARGRIYEAMRMERFAKMYLQNTQRDLPAQLDELARQLTMDD